MTVLKRVVDRMFQPRYLLWTNIGVSGALMGCGDVTAQFIERRMLKKQGKHDWRRTGRLTLIGLVLGPFNHGWYTFLDRVFPATNLLTVSKKILADQLCASPFFAFTFFMGASQLEGESLDRSWKEFKGKFWTVYKADWTVWPAAQSINFMFVPARFRVLYVCTLTLMWDCFLCVMKQQENLPD